MRGNRIPSLRWSIYLIISGILVFYGIQYRQLNWDIIGYTGASYFSDGLSAGALRDKTYAEIKTVSPQSTYEELTQSSPYRIEVFNSIGSLEEHMPFYSIRVGYIASIKIISSLLSLLYAQSTYVLSALFAGISVLLLGALFPSENKWALLAFPITLCFAGFLELASLSSPDSMAASLVLLCLLIYKRNPYLALVPLTLAPCIRTDYVILAGLLALVAAHNKRLLLAALFIALPLISYVAMNELNNNYGYLKIFNFTLIAIDPHPATMTIETTIQPYLRAYERGFGSLLGHRHFIIYLAYFVVWWKKIRFQKKSHLNEQVFLVLGFVVLHMLLFPAYYQRFFAWCAAIAGLQLVSWSYELKFHRTLINLFKRHEK